MKFANTTFDISTQVQKGTGAIVTRLTLTECEIPDEVILSTLISGQSPRVRLQNKFRADGIPKEMEMSWEQYVIPGRAPRVVVPETAEQIAERAQKDPALLAALLDKLGFSVAEDDNSAE